MLADWLCFFILWGMNGLPLRWKVFRLMCIFQLIMVLYSLVMSSIRLFTGTNTWSDLIGIISYALIFLFLCLGLSILNDNFPDTPLTLTQKRRFNILFLVNFILIAFLFAKTVQVWRIMPFINIGTIIKSSLFFNLLFFIFQTIVVFIFHLLFLYGMYRLRQLIYQNTVTGWYEQFDRQDTH
jgi:hypothetical protein